MIETMDLGAGLLLATGFEDAFLGIGSRFGWHEPVAVYDHGRCLQILEERDGMTPEGAVEFFDFNVLGAWVGEQTPMFVAVASLAEVEEEI